MGDGDSLSSWQLIDDAELMEQPDPEWLVDGMLGRRTVGALYGPPSTGKTTMAAALSVAVATGRPFLGHRVMHRGSVVYVGPDDPGGWKPRLAAAKRDLGLPLDKPVGIYLFTEPFNLLEAQRVETLSAFLRGYDWPAPIALVIIDTYAACLPGANENGSEDTTRAMAALQSLRSAVQATVLLCHHTNAGGSRERGHSALRGAMDTMLALTQSDDIVKLECSKQRNGAPFPPITLRLAVQDGGCVFKLAADVAATTELTAIQRKVFDALRDNFSADGATKAEWQRVCSDVAERSFHRATKVLQSHQMVRASGPRFIPVEASS